LGELWCLIPLLTIFQLYHGYLVLLVEYTEKTTDLPQVCSMNVHTMFGFNLPSGFRGEDQNLKAYRQWMPSESNKSYDLYILDHSFVHLKKGGQIGGVIVFNATFNNISVISWLSCFIGGGNRSTRRKSPTCRKSLTNFIT
jgi:hypothetical protein